MTDNTLLPPWALREATGEYREVGAQLCTKDGRKCGNAFVYAFAENHAEVITTSGTLMLLTEAEMAELFYPPQYIVDVEASRRKYAPRLLEPLSVPDELSAEALAAASDHLVTVPVNCLLDSATTPMIEAGIILDYDHPDSHAESEVFVAMVTLGWVLDQVVEERIDGQRIVQPKTEPPTADGVYLTKIHIIDGGGYTWRALEFFSDGWELDEVVDIYEADPGDFEIVYWEPLPRVEVPAK